MASKNYGALFTNKKTKETQPDFKGNVTINGVEWELSGWRKEGKNGPFISIQANEPYQKPQTQPQPIRNNDLF